MVLFVLEKILTQEETIVPIMERRGSSVFEAESGTKFGIGAVPIPGRLGTQD